MLLSALQLFSILLIKWLQVLGISVDSQFSHLAWIQTGKGLARAPFSTPGHAVPIIRLDANQRKQLQLVDRGSYALQTERRVELVT